MEKNIRKKIKDTKGITLVALVVTIIVLLILAGVALSSVLSQDGIFNKVEQAVDKHGEAKARETLELLLGEAQMQKYEQGLTDEQLTEKINEIGEELPKEKPEHPELQNVIVDGHIFEIDRSVPKIVDYIGPADGVIITASINGLSNGWMKPSEVANITVTGTIKTYSGGSITTVSATKGETVITDFSIDKEGKYIIDSITENTIITINAEDSNNNSNSKIVSININLDKVTPKVTITNAEVNGWKMIIGATAIDNESGIKKLEYDITPTLGIEEKKTKGELIIGESIEIITTKDETYTITITATDNCDNIGTETITLMPGTMTLAEAKEKVNGLNLHEYIGIRIRDYNPKAGGNWRIFYLDEDNYFGDGNDTMYLKRDYDDNLKTSLSNKTLTTNGDIYMRKMNPTMDKYYGDTELTGEDMAGASWLCNTNNWLDYKTDKVLYAIGASGLEMFILSFNAYKNDGEIRTAVFQRWNYNNYYFFSGSSILWNYSGVGYGQTMRGAIESGPRKYLFE